MDPSAQPVTGAAQRRKQRRLRSWWRHEQHSIAAVLATVWHHSYSKVGTANAALRGQKTGTSTRVGLAEYYELSSDDGRLPRGAASGTVGVPAARKNVDHFLRRLQLLGLFVPLFLVPGEMKLLRKKGWVLSAVRMALQAMRCRPAKAWIVRHHRMSFGQIFGC